MRYVPERPYEGLNGRPNLFVDESPSSKFRSFFNRLLSPAGLLIMLILMAVVSISIATFGAAAGFISLAVLVGLPTVYTVIVFPRLGIIILMIFAYFIMFMIRIIQGLPLGTIMDLLQWLLIFGFFLRQKYERNWKILKTPISAVILIWIAYNLLQVANPTTEARMAWLYTVRTVAIVTLMYFIFTYYIRTVQYIRLIFKVWISLAVFAAIYAVKQEYFGFFEFEERELQDPLAQLLLFINGSWRKFSIFSDPVAFSYNMVASAVFCIVMALGHAKRKSKIIYACLTAFFITVMLYSGTRGAYVLVPAAMLLYVVMNISKKTFIIAAVGGLLFMILINMPTSNTTLYRFQSAFKPSDDASFNVRKQNQKMIQPYILTHPLGGGLGATGVWGVRFAPYSFLANFPPDSGYVRVAVELGSIGLLLFCIMMYTILHQGITGYFNIRDPELRTYCLAMTLVIFALNIGNYPQEALVQFPSNIFFYLFVAIVSACIRMDKEETKKESESTLDMLLS
ncbi:O-antigen ligase family protein [Desertivirga xinjiangensis]|uniref:O-antigen ligase family protein n=1 Tax=Desertivirga xinjiangensis TaxID=539206 RepID=UPI00210CCF37|nr:O-antigen ligase family protein [Pedobacter xinjiangensis]